MVHFIYKNSAQWIKIRLLQFKYTLSPSQNVKILVLCSAKAEKEFWAEL